MTPQDLARAARCTTAPINSLRRKGFIIARAGRIERRREAGPPAGKRQAKLAMNPDQQKALDVILAAVRAQQHKTILIHGVTGSGKTEVYLQAIAEVVSYGRQAIVLVPGDQPHAADGRAVSPSLRRGGGFAQPFERRRAALALAADRRRRGAGGGRRPQRDLRPHAEPGPDRLGRGARGLVQAGDRPAVSRPGRGRLSAPRRRGRRWCSDRRRLRWRVGSAPPRGESTLVEMPRRVLGRPMPLVGSVDLRIDLRRRASSGAVSRPLRQAIAAALADDGQVILLLNRRGYSTHIQCPACGMVMRCPDCDIALTHHRTEDIALCHYCDYQTPAPAVCPECDFAGINFRGYGTQRLEAELRRSFPDVPCLRMDTDTMRRPGSHERAFADFRAGKVKILLGTQMIAKGLDFPNVTLVGVINADTALHLPDFRAAERTFQLVTQVAGRTGRGPKGGRVLVQTFNPDHAAIRAAVRHDFAAFAAGELPLRGDVPLSAVRVDDPAGDSRARSRPRPPSSPGGWPRDCGERWRPSRPTRGCWGPPRPRLPGCAASFAFRFRCRGPTAPPCARPSARRPQDCGPPRTSNGWPTSIRWTCCRREIRNPKHGIRSTKSEARNPKQTQNTKPK